MSDPVPSLQDIHTYLTKLNDEWAAQGLPSALLSDPSVSTSGAAALVGIQAAVRLTERLVAVEMEFEGFVASLFVEAPMATIVVDKADTIQGWNPSALNIYGWTAEDIVGRTLADTILPERYRERHKAGIQRFAQTGKSRGLFSRLFRAPVLHRDGHEFEIDVMILPMRYRGQFQFLSFSHDAARTPPHIDELLAALPGQAPVPPHDPVE